MAIKAIHKKRLLKLAEHLEKGKLIHKKFDFSVFNIEEKNVDSPFDLVEAKPYTCGTLGCALGEMPAVSNKWNFNSYAEPHLKGSRKEAFASATEWFGLPEWDIYGTGAAGHLFSPGMQNTNLYDGKHLGADATAKQVAANIRAYVKKMEKDAGR